MVNTVYKAGEDGPILSYTRTMLADTGEWRMLGDYAIWSGSRTKDQSPHLLHELTGNRVLPVPISEQRAIVYKIAGDTWFEVRHLFGFWMKCDVDTVWIDAPGPNDAHYYSLCVGGADNRPGKVSIGWVCPDCGALLSTQSFETASKPFGDIIVGASEIVQNFNNNVEKRICLACSHEHPITYGFFPRDDNEAERTARQST